MSEKDFSKDVPRSSEEHADEEAESSSSGNDTREPETEEAGRSPVTIESKDSDHDSPPLEGAVGGETSNEGVGVKKRGKKRLSAGKADLFRKFFSKEYTQVKAPILDRHRHKARRQPQGQFAFSDSSSVDSDPLANLRLLEPGSELVLNGSGADGEKTSPTDLEQFGNGNRRRVHSEPSVGNASEHIDVYEGNLPLSRPSSDSSRGLSPGSSFPSFPSRPPTDASDNPKETPIPDSESPEDGRLSPTPTDSATVAHGRPAREKFAVTQPVPIRSKSALAGFSGYADELQKRKLSKAFSVCSEPLPERKISKDSSDGSYEQMSSEDEETHYPELSHSVDSDSCLPMPDLDQGVAENLREGLDGLRVSAGVTPEIKPDGVDHNMGQETDESEQDPVSVLSSSPGASKKPPE